MQRGGPQVSAQDNSQQQQKQKKKLSFRDPEVEGPLRNYLYAGCKSKTLTKPTKATNSKKTSASVEDLTLEDQALQIAQSVGNAFSDLSVTDNDHIDYSGLESADFEAQKETEIRDSSPTDFVSYQRNYELRNFPISAEDQEFLDDLAPSLLDETMRGPSTESSDPTPPKNCIPAEPSFQEAGRFSSSLQHQIQMLKYQLEQQNQQTQMAMHQVQLLQDQMDAESAARRKAQEQNNQLMQQNKELLNHMEKLFQQIEELEKQIQILEQEKRGKRVIATPENLATSLRKPTTWSANRRPSSELVNEKPTKWTASQRQNNEHMNEKPSTWATTRKPSSEQMNEKPTLQNRNQYTANKKSTATSVKPLGATPKTTTTQNSISSLSTRKTPSIPARPLTFHSKTKDSGIKEKETLRIGDTSPPVQSGTTSPFSSNWKLKAPDNTQSSTDKSPGYGTRGRTGSFSSYVQRMQEGDTAKSSLFSSTNSSLSSASITGKKYSSSTSDLYNTSSVIQGKPSLSIEEPSTSVKSAVSNLNISTSKLPRYQPYTGWRRASLTGESDQVSALSKESYKNPPKTSLFNR